MRLAGAVLLLATLGCSSPNTAALEQRIADLEAKLAARDIECDSLTVGNVQITQQGLRTTSPECSSIVSAQRLVVVSSTNKPVLLCAFTPKENSAALTVWATSNQSPSVTLQADVDRASVQVSGGGSTRHGVNIAATSRNAAGLQLMAEKQTLWGAVVGPEGSVTAGTQR